ncbi:hypothetical protein BJX99DRAFT_255205 [Aspergillus californicus]
MSPARSSTEYVEIFCTHHRPAPHECIFCTFCKTGEDCPAANHPYNTDGDVGLRCYECSACSHAVEAENEAAFTEETVSEKSGAEKEKNDVEVKKEKDSTLEAPRTPENRIRFSSTTPPPLKRSSRSKSSFPSSSSSDAPSPREESYYPSSSFSSDASSPQPYVKPKLAHFTNANTGHYWYVHVPLKEPCRSDIFTYRLALAELENGKATFYSSATLEEGVKVPDHGLSFPVNMTEGSGLAVVRDEAKEMAKRKLRCMRDLAEFEIDFELHN